MASSPVEIEVARSPRLRGDVPAGGHIAMAAGDFCGSTSDSGECGSESAGSSSAEDEDEDDASGSESAGSSSGEDEDEDDTSGSELASNESGSAYESDGAESALSFDDDDDDDDDWAVAEDIPEAPAAEERALAVRPGRGLWRLFEDLSSMSSVSLGSLATALVDAGMLEREMVEAVLGQNSLRQQLQLTASSARYQTDFVEMAQIGRGGFGSVFRARHRLDQQHYAVKKIKRRINTGDPDSLSRLGETAFREAQHLSRLCHPNVVRYFAAWIEVDLGEQPEPLLLRGPESSTLSFDSMEEFSSFASSTAGGAEPSDATVTLFLQMELCSGTLHDWLRRRRAVVATENLLIIKQLVKALDHIHSAGIVHADLSPRNVFMAGAHEIKVGDFGLAQAHLGSSRGHCGTTLYRDPAAGDGHCAHTASDVYALAIIVIELFASFGTESERVQTLMRVREEQSSLELVPAPLAALVDSCLAADPLVRPSVADIVQAPVFVEDSAYVRFLEYELSKALHRIAELEEHLDGG